jgi:hypothetical protein
MQDVYTAKAEDLNEYVQAFECLPQQRGSLVFINGEPAGFDVISREGAYAELHQKLVRSYAMDTLLQRKERFDEPSVDKARVFLKEARECEESKFASTGQGLSGVTRWIRCCKEKSSSMNPQSIRPECF